MKRSVIALAIVAAISFLVVLPLSAQHGGKPNPPANSAQRPNPPAGGNSPAVEPRANANSSKTATSSKTSPSGEKKKTVGELVEQNTKLSSKLQDLLPAGADVQQASQGFKNVGQFVAAAHVAHNLGIPFDQLKSRVTGPNAVSLGKAIKELNPTANAQAESRKAWREARKDLKESGA